MSPRLPRLALATTVTGGLLIATFGATVVMLRRELRDDVRQKIIERDAAVLYPLAEAQLSDAESNPDNRDFGSEMLLSSVLKSWQQLRMRGIVIYDADGNTLQVQPNALYRTELSPNDYTTLMSGAQISRYREDFPLDDYFSDVEGPAEEHHAPVLEVLLPLRAGDSGQTVGFVRYYLKARRLAAELDAIDARVNRQTAEMLGIGSALIALILAVAYHSLTRAQRIIAERNERLTRANFELTLAAKTSALGVITSHLIHGLQGPVAGLRAMAADRAADGTSGTDWQSAADYADRMQAMIHETVALLGDTSTQTTYELTGVELANSIRERNRAAAVAKGVIVEVNAGFPETVDSHRGSLVCLIATNLIQNAIEATDPGRHVEVSLTQNPDSIMLVVRDEGAGIPDAVRPHLFEPGRSGRAGGTGLGLSISQLLARQIEATLELVESGPTGTTFRLTVPIA